jgi:O-antigen ligase
MGILNLAGYKKEYLITFLVLSIAIGFLSAVNAPLALVIGCLFILLIFTILYPFKLTIIMISVWSIIQGILGDIYVAGFPTSQLFIPLLLSTIFLAIMIRKKVDNTYLGLSLAYLIMVIWSVLGLAHTTYLEDAMTSYARLLVGWFIFHYFITAITDEKKNNFLANSIVIGGAVSALLTIMEYVLYSMFGLKEVLGFVIVTEYYGEVFRPNGGFGGPVASAISLYAIYIISAYLYSKTKSRLYLFTSVLIILGIFSTLTRTVILAIIITLILQATYLSFVKRDIKPLLYTFTTLMIVSLLAYTFARDIIESRLVDFINPSNIEMFGGGRFGIWLSIIEGVKQEGTFINSIIGHGISISRYFVYKYSSFKLEDYTHNDYLDTYLSNGIVGLFLLVYFILAVFRILTRNKVKYKLHFAIPYFVYLSIVMSLANTQYSAGQRWMLLITIVYMIKEIYFSNQKSNSKINLH